MIAMLVEKARVFKRRYVGVNNLLEWLAEEENQKKKRSIVLKEIFVNILII